MLTNFHHLLSPGVRQNDNTSGVIPVAIVALLYVGKLSNALFSRSPLTHEERVLSDPEGPRLITLTIAPTCPQHTSPEPRCAECRSRSFKHWGWYDQEKQRVWATAFTESFCTSTRRLQCSPSSKGLYRGAWKFDISNQRAAEQILVGDRDTHTAEMWKC